MKNEEWRDILETKGEYCISNKGRVRDRQGKYVKIYYMNGTNHARAILRCNGTTIVIHVANFVAKYFINKYAKFVTFKDKNPRHITVSNLIVKTTSNINFLDKKEDLEWKAIEEHLGYYISNYGDVKSDKGNILYNKNNTVSFGGPCGYSVLNLVIKYFIEGDYKGYKNVEFIDGDESNLYYKNLIVHSANINDHEWRTIKDSTFIISENGIVVNPDMSSIIEPREINNRLVVSIVKNRKRTACSLSKLIAEAFIPNEEHYAYTKYQDGDIYNNDYLNIYWSKQSAGI